MDIFIYQIVCVRNNKRYIGRTADLKSRFKRHLRDLRMNKHYNKYLQNDFNIYGVNSFLFELIEISDDELACSREDYWISFYGGIESVATYNFQNNLTKNSEHRNLISKSKVGTVPWNRGRKMSLEELEVNRRSYLGIKRSKESIEKQKQTIANNPNFGNKGKHLSESTKEKLSKAKIGKIPYNKGKTKYTQELIDGLKEDLRLGKFYEYIIEKYKPEFKLDKYFINKLIKHNGPPYMGKKEV